MLVQLLTVVVVVAIVMNTSGTNAQNDDDPDAGGSYGFSSGMVHFREEEESFSG